MTISKAKHCISFLSSSPGFAQQIVRGSITLLDSRLRESDDKKKSSHSVPSQKTSASSMVIIKERAAFFISYAGLCYDNGMKKSFSIMILALFLLAPGTSQAAAVKDSIYFMMDDGEMSQEEMQEEAMYVQEQCQNNLLKGLYYNCECIAGAFLMRREQLGPMYPQNDLVYDIFMDDSINCSYPERIAASGYAKCQEYVKFFRTRRDDNEEYCECVGNRLAITFSNDPRLKTDYIEDLRGNAREYCENPNNR